MTIELSQRIPRTGKVEIGQIIELMQGVCAAGSIEQSTITGDSDLEAPFCRLLRSIKSGENDEKNPFKTYVLEHEGHFILLNLKRSADGVSYSIYDSLADTPHGWLRGKRIEKILKEVFSEVKVTQGENKYIEVNQGEGVLEGEDADNCGLTSVLAQFIFDKFEDFPRDVFVANVGLYRRLNNIAQKFRGEKFVPIEEILEEVNQLALDIKDRVPVEEELLEVSKEIPLEGRVEIGQIAELMQGVCDTPPMRSSINGEDKDTLFLKLLQGAKKDPSGTYMLEDGNHFLLLNIKKLQLV